MVCWKIIGGKKPKPNSKTLLFDIELYHELYHMLEMDI